MKRILVCFLLFLSFSSVQAQQGIIRGRVYNAVNNEGIPLANVLIEGTQKGSSTDMSGNYEIKGLEPGLYNLEVSYLGFKKEVVYSIPVTSARPAIVNFGLKEDVTSLKEIEVTASPFSKTDESPVSLRSIGAEEIRRNPGSNRDISKVIRTLPGAATVPSFRNDVIIRGGAPNENRFFLDGIEVPIINHFQTQGSSGGPVGLINVDFVEEVEFYSSAFPANRASPLSGLFEFKQKDGRSDKLIFNAILGASDVGATLEGPLSEKSSFIFSARRSYLQFLFKALGLPFLPTYNDAQFKYTYQPNERNKFTLLGLGAIDDFELNLDANETEEQRYILNYLPISDQWNFTVGGKWEHFVDNGSYTFVLSHNKLNNQTVKYADNDDTDPANKLADYHSYEQEVKLRLERYLYRKSGFRLNTGLNASFGEYYANNFFKAVIDGQPFTYDFQSELQVNQAGAFAQASQDLLSGQLILSAGLRVDGADYSSETAKFWQQLSPRLAASWYFMPRWSLNASIGRYYQLPSYVLLGYREFTDGPLINQENGITYIQSDHLVAGLEFTPTKFSKITLEGFLKYYDNYPLLLDEGISLANLGADFGVIGNNPASPASEGRAYGLELLAQQKLSDKFYGTLAYTLVRSEFTGATGIYQPSAWDFRHIVSLTGGKRLPRNWELGGRFLLSGGPPYTPYDIQASSFAPNWDRIGQGIPDYDRLNSRRLSAFHQLDLRVDKKYFFPKWSLNLYFDVQNVYGFQTQFQDNIDVVRNAEGNPVRQADNPDFYQIKFLENTNGTTLPTLGIIVEL